MIRAHENSHRIEKRTARRAAILGHALRMAFWLGRVVGSHTIRDMVAACAYVRLSRSRTVTNCIALDYDIAAL